MQRSFATSEMLDAIPAYYARDVRTGDGKNGPLVAAVEVRA